jgi:hypothetical protein
LFFPWMAFESLPRAGVLSRAQKPTGWRQPRDRFEPLHARFGQPGDSLATTCTPVSGLSDRLSDRLCCRRGGRACRSAMPEGGALERAQTPSNGRQPVRRCPKSRRFSASPVLVNRSRQPCCEPCALPPRTGQSSPSTRSSMTGLSQPLGFVLQYLSVNGSSRRGKPAGPSPAGDDVGV